MPYIGKEKKYRGYLIKFWRDVWGYVNAEIRRERDRQFIEKYDSYVKTVKESFNDVKERIDSEPYYETENGWLEIKHEAI